MIYHQHVSSLLDLVCCTSVSSNIVINDIRTHRQKILREGHSSVFSFPMEKLLQSQKHPPPLAYLVASEASGVFPSIGHWDT